MPFETGKPPNKYTMAMGELIRKAREESGLTQEQLAEKIYRKKLAVSEMENGKVEINAWVLLYLSQALEKPISYFFPKRLLNFDPDQDKLSEMEKDLINHFRFIEYEELKRVAIDQIKALATYNPYDHIKESYDIFEESILTREEYIKRFIKKRGL